MSSIIEEPEYEEKIIVDERERQDEAEKEDDDLSVPHEPNGASYKNK